jgi:hypothetical protein
MSSCLADQLPYCPPKDDTTIFHHSEVLARVSDIFDNMGREQHAAISGQVRKKIAETNAFFRIEDCCRLVYNEERGMVEQRR